MSRIQELLAKQRGQQNVTAEKPVLQLETFTPQTQLSEEAKQIHKPSLFERLGKKPVEQTSNSIQTNGNNTSVVEQGPLNGSSTSKETILSNDQGQSNNVAENAIINERISISETPTNIKPIQEISQEIMPFGLSMLAQMKWKREHVTPHNQRDVNPQPNNVEQLDETKTLPIVSTAQSAELSASQAADKEKSNDGLANIEELKRNLAYLANNIENKDLVGQVVRTIASQLKNSPELTPNMTNADVNLVVRGARMAYQIAAMKKQEKADTKKAKSKDTEALDNFFKDAGINFNL